MKARYTSSLILFLLFGLWTQAQNNISGTVCDQKTKQLLSKVSIILLPTNIGTSTNNKGEFQISNIKKENITLEFSHIGYKTETLQIDFSSNKNQKLKVKLKPQITILEQSIVTATRTEQQISTLPMRAAVITTNEIENYPSLSTDNLLRNIAGLVVNRSWGIFSKNSSVTMRGLDGSSRTLILLDGVPINKTAGGSVTWEMIQPEQIEKIEVVKGPNSALYGNNAMAGTINILTKRPKPGTSALAKTYAGSYNALGGFIQAGQNNIKNEKGFYAGINAGYREGDGYILEPLETRDSNNAKAFLKEYNARTVLGYQFNENQEIELEYFYHKGKHGAGRRIFEEDGSFDQYQINLTSMKYTGKIGQVKIHSNLFFHQEDYTKQRESLNSTGKYKLSEAFSIKKDYALWTSATWSPTKNQELTLGFDFKQGIYDVKDIYRTSTDILKNGGDLRFFGIYAQDKINLLKDKLIVIANVRMDFAEFYDGYLQVTDPTSNTGFINNYKDDFSNHSWSNFSPKLALMYNLSAKLNTYVSVSSGFMPPKLDDLTRSGKITKGFKLANPKLKPETITTYELGWNYAPSEKIKFEPSIYFSNGKDLQYFVGTGDSIDTGGTSLKPELQRQNITEVQIMGFELTTKWKPSKSLLINANYSYSYSEIQKFETDTETNKDLRGKHLIEVPEHMAGLMLFWRNKYLNTTFVWTYMGSQWYDDKNTIKIDAFHVFDLEFSRKIYKNLEAALIVQDLFDRQFVDRKGQLSPGRFFMGELKLKL
jgi:iron complex outermembrane recepter protein